MWCFGGYVLPSTRNISIDIARGIAMLLVVMGHTHMPKQLFKFICVFHVPLFFFLSGYVFNYNKWKNKWSEFLENRFCRIIKPYFLTSIFIFYPLWFFVARHFGDSSKLNLSPVKMFVGIFYGCGNQYLTFNSPLWFLPCLFLGYIIFFWLLKLSDLSQSVFCSVILLFTCTCIGLFLSSFFTFPWSLDIAMVIQPFFMAGYYIQSKGIVKNSYVSFLSFGLLIVCFFLNNNVDTNARHYGNIFLYYTGGIAGSVFVIWLSAFIKNLKVLSLIGKESMTVLLWHNWGLKITSLIFIIVFHCPLQVAKQHYIIYSVFSIMFSFCILRLRTVIQNWLRKNQHYLIAELFTW